MPSYRVLFQAGKKKPGGKSRARPEPTAARASAPQQSGFVRIARSQTVSGETAAISGSTAALPAADISRILSDEPTSAAPPGKDSRAISASRKMGGRPRGFKPRRAGRQPAGVGSDGGRRRFGRLEVRPLPFEQVHLLV